MKANLWLILTKRSFETRPGERSIFEYANQNNW